MATYERGFKPATFSSATALLTYTVTHHKNDFTSLGSTIPVAHLVGSGQVLTLVTAGGRAVTSGVSGSAQYAIYETDATGLSQGAMLGIVATIATSSPSVTWYNSSALSVSLAAHVGKYIKLAVANDVGWRRAYVSGTSGDVVSGADAFPNPFGTPANQSLVNPFYMTIVDPSQSINSTNSGANDINAGAVNTASVTGYVVGVNPVVSGTVGSLALTSVSQATTIATFTIPAPVNDSYWPQPDTSHTLTLTDSSNPSTFNAVMNSLAGYTSIVLASPDLADTHKIPYWLTSTAVDDDRIMYKTADMTVAADGGISGATLGVTTIYYHWRVADSKIYAYEALLSEDGIVTSTGLTVRGLSVSGLGVRGLTVRGL